MPPYRWNTNLVGQLVVYNYWPHEIVPLYTTYVPSLIEVLSGAGVIAYGLLAFTLGVRYLKVVDHSPVAEMEVVARPVVVAAAD